ncbi:MAG: 3-hydroxyacyl-ACP dehydratase FabZ [Alistipes sp.]|nr:3-hydroxyacyl-ACP dehydratase FabZ [Alistipes sp.]
MNREEIKNYLPHREPMLLVDDITLDGEWADAHYHVTGEEFFLKGHFPGNPVVPGVITCEIIAQSCALLLGDLLKGRTPFYAGIDNVKFKSAVHPGDTLHIRARITQQRGLLVFTEAKAFVEDRLACLGNFSFMLVDNDKIKK